MPKPVRVRTRPRVRAPERTRETILQTAAAEFYRHGFQGGSLNRIIADAGVTKGSLFHHYEGKHALGFAVIEEVVGAKIAEVWVKPLATSVDPVSDLQAIVRRVMLSRRKNPEKLAHGCPLNNFAQEMAPLDEGFRRRTESIYETWRASLAAALTRGIKAGIVRREVVPRRVAAFVVAAMTGIIGTAKNAQSETLLADAGEELLAYLGDLKP